MRASPPIHGARHAQAWASGAVATPKRDHRRPLSEDWSNRARENAWGAGASTNGVTLPVGEKPDHQCGEDAHSVGHRAVTPWSAQRRRGSSPRLSTIYRPLVPARGRAAALASSSVSAWKQGSGQAQDLAGGDLHGFIPLASRWRRRSKSATAAAAQA